MATMVNTTRPGMTGMATLVIRPVMTETLIMVATMVAIVGILLLQMGLGMMWGWSRRRKGGYSCNVIEAIFFDLAWRCKVIILTMTMIWKTDSGV